MRAPLSLVDKLVLQIDLALKSVAGGAQTQTRQSPGVEIDKSPLTLQEAEKSARLMRVNHSGEVCAQALYQGQAFTASSVDIKQTMKRAAAEEIDHLAWCESRVKELNGHLSFLNPFWYLASLLTGMVAGSIGDRFNLGFLAATEDLVCEHLDAYIDKLPESDLTSKSILTQMKLDEGQHAVNARDAGGVEFTTATKKAMRFTSRLMTLSTYRI